VFGPPDPSNIKLPKLITMCYSKEFYSNPRVLGPKDTMSFITWTRIPQWWDFVSNPHNQTMLFGEYSDFINWNYLSIIFSYQR